MSGAADSKIEVTAGQRFGFWTVVEPLPRAAGGRTRWLCRCHCGTERPVLAQTLRKRESASCGCQMHSMRTTRRLERLAAADKVSLERRDAIELLKCALLVLNRRKYGATAENIERFLTRAGELPANQGKRSAA